MAEEEVRAPQPVINLAELKSTRKEVAAGERRVEEDDGPFVSTTDDPLGRWTVTEPEDVEGASPDESLIGVARSGAMDVLEETLGRKPNINTKDGIGNTPLHYMAMFGHAEATERFLKEDGLLLNVANFEGDTPLHLATIEDQQETMQLLLDARVNPTLRNNDGNRPIDIAQSDEAVAMLEAAIFSFRKPRNSLVLAAAEEDDVDEDSD